MVLYFCPMKKLPIKLEKRLQKRKELNSFRSLAEAKPGVDFFSNDYLGFSTSHLISENAKEIMRSSELRNGATGSRLLSGNHSLFKKLEDLLCDFHNAEAALVFNSGYDANIGFFSAVPQKNDVIFYDEFSHASIRDGIKMSLARSYKFRHNDLEDLQKKLENLDPRGEDSEIYVVTETVFSMDGDSPDLVKLAGLAEEFNFHLIVDEAHATGIYGKKGEGLLQKLECHDKVFARIHTFGKAIGCHGAAVLGGSGLRDYLINFSRSFIYTTALSPHSVASVIAAYEYLEKSSVELNKLRYNIEHFKEEIKKHALQEIFTESDSAIQSCILEGNSRVKQIAEKLQEHSFMVKAILSPTVPEGKERLRFCIHSYNSKEEISEVLKLLANFARNFKYV